MCSLCQKNIRKRQHTEQWYAVRFERIREYAQQHGWWHDIAAIIANGCLTGADKDGNFIYEPPTYAQQLNRAIFRAEAAEKKAERAGEVAKVLMDRIQEMEQLQIRSGSSIG